MPSPQPATLGLRPRASARLRCVFCHDALGGAAVVCAVCGAVAHAECTAASSRCTTLACSGELARPRLAWLRSRVATLVALGLLLSPLAVGGVMLWFKWRDGRVVPHGPLVRWVDNSGRSFVPDTSCWTFTVLSDRRSVCALDDRGQPRWCVDVVRELGGPQLCAESFGSPTLGSHAVAISRWNRRCVSVGIGRGGVFLDCGTGEIVGSESD